MRKTIESQCSRFLGTAARDEFASFELVGRFFRALGRRHTYDLRRNPEAWFGLLLGLAVPVVTLGIEALVCAARHVPPFSFLAFRPWIAALFVQPAIFAVVFGALGTIRHDLEQRSRQLIERLDREATTDPLTGVRNRRFVMEELTRAAIRGMRGETFAIVLFDLDNFKAVNDTMGHQAGDDLLRRVAQTLREALRESDVLGRYGGDEFLLVAPGPRDAAAAVAERARATVVMRTGISVSAGIACWDQDGGSPHQLVAAADRFLSQLKAARRASGR